VRRAFRIRDASPGLEPRPQGVTNVRWWIPSEMAIRGGCGTRFSRDPLVPGARAATGSSGERRRIIKGRCGGLNRSGRSSSARAESQWSRASPRLPLRPGSSWRRSRCHLPHSRARCCTTTSELAPRGRPRARRKPYLAVAESRTCLPVRSGAAVLPRRRPISLRHMRRGQLLREGTPRNRGCREPAKKEPSSTARRSFDQILARSGAARVACVPVGEDRTVRCEGQEVIALIAFAGGLEAVSAVLEGLPEDIPAAVSSSSTNSLIERTRSCLSFSADHGCRWWPRATTNR
jgi:hypothetical protein